MGVYLEKNSTPGTQNLITNFAFKAICVSQEKVLRTSFHPLAVEFGGFPVKKYNDMFLVRSFHVCIYLEEYPQAFPHNLSRAS